ncbi:MAG: YhbY family RNA-binding protein, partial [Pseudomonadota bacterium]
MNSKQISYLRGLAHNLNPVVMISNKGLSEAVLKEINLNLDAHELIKIKVAGDDRELRAQ